MHQNVLGLIPNYGNPSIPPNTSYSVAPSESVLSVPSALLVAVRTEGQDRCANKSCLSIIN